MEYSLGNLAKKDGQFALFALAEYYKLVTKSCQASY